MYWHIIVWLTAFTDLAVALVLATQFWALRNGKQNKLVRYLAAFFFTLFLRGVAEVWVALYVSTIPVDDMKVMWLGRLGTAISLWALFFCVGRKPTK